MPTLKEVIDKENEQRQTSEEVRTVRLTRMGNFIRAYDWSAWLLKRQGSPLNVGLDTTSGIHHVFVGFPLASIDKFQPEGSEARKDGEGVPAEWILAAETFPPEEAFNTLEKTSLNSAPTLYFSLLQAVRYKQGTNSLISGTSNNIKTAMTRCYCRFYMTQSESSIRLKMFIRIILLPRRPYQFGVDLQQCVVSGKGEESLLQMRNVTIASD